MSHSSSDALSDRSDRVRAARGHATTAANTSAMTSVVTNIASQAAPHSDRCDVSGGIRNYVPRSGAGADYGNGGASNASAIPKAPNSVARGPDAAAGAVGAAVVRASTYLQISRTRKWLTMLGDWGTWRGAGHSKTVKAR